MKNAILFVMAVFAAVGLLAGCGAPSKSTVSSEETAAKTKLKIYGEVTEYTSGSKMWKAVQEQLNDTYQIEMVPVDWANLERVIRTQIASGQPCDAYVFSSNLMSIFKEQAIDLTPYLEEDGGIWKNNFDPLIYDMANIDGKMLSVPWETNFPALLANKAIFNEAGVMIPEKWTFDVFMAACEKIKNTGKFPLAVPMDLAQAGWLFRNTIVSAAVNHHTYDQYIKAEMPFEGQETIDTLYAIKSLYDKKYVYPDEGAVIAKTDEIRAAFLQGKVAMIANIATGAYRVVTGADFETVSVPWPSIGEKTATTGIASGLFIPKNSKNIDAAVEVLKVFTSEKIQRIHKEEGYLPANKNVKITDPFVQSLAAQMKDIYGVEFPADVQFTYYFNNQLIPDLVLNGGVKQVMEKLENIRKNYLAEQNSR